MLATIVSTDAERVPFWSALIRDRRIAPALGLGFTSGMPFLLTYSTQSAWVGASAIWRPAQARSTSPIKSFRRTPISAWRP
jgi:hypothetical protein